MQTSTAITALPIGEIEAAAVREEFDAVLQVFIGLGADVLIAEPITDESGLAGLEKTLRESPSDLLLVVPLRGLSASLIEAAARWSQAPCLIWPVQGRFALPSSALALGALRESGLPVELLYAPAGNPKGLEIAQSILRAAKAYSRLRRSRIGIIGGLFPNLVSCRYDPNKVTAKLGVDLQKISFDEVRTISARITPTSHEVVQQRERILRSFDVQAEDSRALDAGLQLHLALKEIARERKIDGFATECWSGFPTHLGLNSCLGFIAEDYRLACEGDVMLCVSLLLVRFLTGSSAYVGDLFDVDLEGNLTLVHCGAPASLDASAQKVALVQSPLAQERGFETLTCRPRLAPGPVTLFRFYGMECDRMHVAAGELAGSDPSVNLSVKIRLEGDRWDFLSECLGNHYLVVTGDIRKELRLLGKWLKIKLFNT